MRTVFTIKEQNRPQPDTLYLDIRPGIRELRYQAHRLKLPLRQFKFIQALMANHPKPMTHWDLFYHVWGEGSSFRQDFTDENGGPLAPNSCIEQYAAKLRKKLAPIGLTVRSERKGYGYQIQDVKVENNNEINEIITAEEAAGKAPRDPRGSKAQQVLRPARGEEIELSPGITLTID